MIKVPIFSDQGERKGLVVLGRDITKKRKVEEQFKKIWQRAKDGMRLTDKDGFITKVNQAFCKIVGMDSNELEGQPISSIYQKDSEYIINKHRERFRNRTIPEKVVDKFHLHNGQTRWFEVVNSFVDFLGKDEQVLAIFRDVTEQKQIETALKRSKSRFKRLFEDMGDAVFVTQFGGQNNGKILEVNKAAVNQTGYSRKELLSMNIVEDLTIESSSKVNLEYIKGQLGQGNKVSTIEKKMKKDGTEYWTEVVLTSIDFNGKDACLSINRDITERIKAKQEKEQLQKQLLQTQKMESIGTLAGGVAHDFNNILTVINGFSQMLMNQIDKSNDIYKKIKSIHKSGQRAADLTKQLLLFSRKEDMELELLDINMVIAELRKMLDRLIGEDIEMSDNLDGNLWSVKADKTQIEQVITNLVVNARDAMPDGGDLNIRTKNVIIDKERAKTIPDITPGKYIRINVEDTGTGIEKSIQKQIFDPFFTTKGMAEGTGMGLSVVHGIVKKHGGLINVYSEPGEGTVFKIYLPSVKEKSEKEETDTSEQHDQYEGRGETILIVEDEKQVLEYLESILDNYGYNYISVKSGEEALQVFGKRKDDIDLLISDVIMTGINGVEIADKLKKEKKGLGIILSSGYSNKKVAKSKIKDKGYQFIQKPYDIMKLLKLIKQSLNNI